MNVDSQTKAIIKASLLKLRSKGYSTAFLNDCDFIAEEVTKELLSEREKYRSGRRLHDRLKDKLLDLIKVPNFFGD